MTSEVGQLNQPLEVEASICITGVSSEVKWILPICLSFLDYVVEDWGDVFQEELNSYFISNFCSSAEQ